MFSLEKLSAVSTCADVGPTCARACAGGRVRVSRVDQGEKEGERWGEKENRRKMFKLSAVSTCADVGPTRARACAGERE